MGGSLRGWPATNQEWATDLHVQRQWQRILVRPPGKSLRKVSYLHLPPSNFFWHESFDDSRVILIVSTRFHCASASLFAHHQRFLFFLWHNCHCRCGVLNDLVGTYSPDFQTPDDKEWDGPSVLFKPSHLYSPSSRWYNRTLTVMGARWICNTSCGPILCLRARRPTLQCYTRKS